jgi:alpha-L-rhamnosidase
MLLADAGLAPYVASAGPAPAAPRGSTPAVLDGSPIWALGDTAPGVVALFRRPFDLPAGLADVQLSIIADTRYEAWLDGRWLGRGPARFSRVRQEFDSLPLGDLTPGPHLLAVLVQYAPNTRRSESLRPALQASVQGWTGTGWQTVTVTGAEWKAIVSPAWDSKAAPVSELQLIGPMEIVDLRQLPAGWSQPGFDDGPWPVAVEILPTPFPALTPRTIPALIEVTHLPTTVVESGLLSPGWEFFELDAPTGVVSTTVSLAVTATWPTVLRIEAVEAGSVAVDDSPPLTWSALADPRRPDVLVASTWVSAGVHRLEIEVPGEGTCLAQLPDGYASRLDRVLDPAVCTAVGGRTLAIAQQGLQISALAGIHPSHDPGRRTLLASPVPGGDAAPQVSLEGAGAEVVLPASSEPRYLVLDFRRTLHGRVVLQAEGPAGTMIDVGWDERLTEGRPLPDPGSLVSNLWSQVDSWILDGTRRALTTVDARAGRYLLLQIWGTGPVLLHQVHVSEERYPAEQVGSFASSDPLLDTIWQVGVDTLRPNMTDAYTDTPWRERGQWWGDAMIAYHANRAVFGDLALLRRGLRQIAEAIDDEGRPPGMAPNWPSGLFMLDFGMLWIEGLYHYWTQSQDLGPVAELYPAGERLAGFLASFEDASGLMNVPPAHWSQSALIDFSAWSSRSGESTALNAQYSAVLRQMGDMAQALGDGIQAQHYRDKSAIVAQRINDVLFLPDEGCYATSCLDGVLIAPTPHAQAWALRYQVVPVERRASTTAALSRLLVPFFSPEGTAVTGPLGMFSILEGLGVGNATATALILIRERYGEMLALGASTWWEGYSPRLSRGHSLSHAWGASPTWFLSSHVLGGRVLSPTTWQVAPHPGLLRYAQGSVPMGSSTLDVAWQLPACGRLDVSLTSPPGTAGDVLLPLHRIDSQVIMDGIVLWDGGPVAEAPVEMTSDGLLISDVAGGHHEILVSFVCHVTLMPVACSTSQIDLQ